MSAPSLSFQRRRQAKSLQPEGEELKLDKTVQQSRESRKTREPDHLLTIVEAAQYLRCTRSWLYSRTAPGSAFSDCPPHLRLENQLRFRRSDLDAWLDQQVHVACG